MKAFREARKDFPFYYYARTHIRTKLFLFLSNSCLFTICRQAASAFVMRKARGAFDALLFVEFIYVMIFVYWHLEERWQKLNELIVFANVSPRSRWRIMQSCERLNCTITLRIIMWCLVFMYVCGKMYNWSGSMCKLF